MSDVDNQDQAKEVNLDNPGPRGLEKQIPLQPEQLAFNDVDTFGTLIVNWFEQRRHDLRNLLDIPAGMEIELTDNSNPDVPEKTMVLDGDKLVAFRLGVQSAMAVLGDLPFDRVPAETGEEADDQPD